MEELEALMDFEEQKEDKKLCKRCKTKFKPRFEKQAFCDDFCFGAHVGRMKKRSITMRLDPVTVFFAIAIIFFAMHKEKVQEKQIDLKIDGPVLMACK